MQIFILSSKILDLRTGNLMKLNLNCLLLNEEIRNLG